MQLMNRPCFMFSLLVGDQLINKSTTMLSILNPVPSSNSTYIYRCSIVVVAVVILNRRAEHIMKKSKQNIRK